MKKTLTYTGLLVISALVVHSGFVFAANSENGDSDKNSNTEEQSAGPGRNPATFEFMKKKAPAPLKIEVKHETFEHVKHLEKKDVIKVNLDQALKKKPEDHKKLNHPAVSESDEQEQVSPSEKKSEDPASPEAQLRKELAKKLRTRPASSPEEKLEDPATPDAEINQEAEQKPRTRPVPAPRTDRMPRPAPTPDQDN